MSGNIALWRAGVLLCVSGLASALPIGAITPALSAMAPALAPGNEGVFLAQLVMTMPGLAMLVTAPLIGWGADRRGHRFMLLAGLAGFTIAGVAGLVIDSSWLLILSRFVLGAASAAVLTPTYALVSYYFADGPRDRLLGLMSGMTAVVVIGASTVAGIMVQRFGWRSPFVLFAVTLLPLFVAMPTITARDGAGGAIRPAPAVPGETIPFASLAGVFALAVWLSTVSFDPTVQLPFLLAERGMRDPRLMSLVLAVMFTPMIVASFFYGRLIARIGTQYAIAFILTLFGVGHLMIGLAGALAPTLAGVACFGTAAAFNLPVIAGYVFAKFPRSTHGRVMGGVLGCLFLGQFINPLVLSPINTALGIASSFVLVGVLNFIGALVVVVSLRCRRRPSQGR